MKVIVNCQNPLIMIKPGGPSVPQSLVQARKPGLYQSERHMVANCIWTGTKYHRNTLKILNVMADHMLGRISSFDDLEDPNQATSVNPNPPNEAQHSSNKDAEPDAEDVEQEDEAKESSMDDENVGGDEDDMSEQGNKEAEVEKSSANIGATNDSGVPSGTIPKHTDMRLTTTDEVLVGLEPLATAPTSPKGKNKKKAHSHSTHSPVKDASPSLKPKKKIP
ncbi:hypothetical protein COLO4_05105 [Corchorus olitorius]|uniref:Uncharacterized protein n=1 Tax=Corchorus olitorius TaxID=93759 RepID=A0A1R3KRW8_9ROSI|nr:hypothetical protein COLO4_05105 [Corchorus olitorius]